MNTRTRNRTDRCQLRSTPTRPWLERGPLIAEDDKPDEFDEPFQSDTLDAMLEDYWPPEDLEDFLDRFD
jgi:hypothetical protein